jgi:S-formylglutathione hydrolase FrmB
MRPLKFPRAALLVLLVFTFVLAGCRSVQQALPDHPRLVAGVVVQDVSFHSTALNREMTYRVYLPEKIAAGKKLPVVYLLHGGNGSFRDWSNKSDTGQYAAVNKSGGLILVMPEGEFSYYMNAAGKPEDKYEDYLTNDLIADVEARFPAAGNRENRAIIGISMGGFAAIKLALSRPELFSFVGAISPAIDVCERRFNLRRTGEWWRLRTIFGSVGSESRTKADPFVLAKSASPAATPYLYLTAGEEEALLAPNKRFAAQLKQRGFAYEFHTRPGGHDWGEWDAQIPGCFESLLKHFNQQQ